MRARVSATWLSLVLLVGLASAPQIMRGQASAGATFSTLYAFSGAGDGGVPSSDLLLAADGNLYGTTIGLLVQISGNTKTSGNYGTIFRLTPSTGSFKTIYTFETLANGVPVNGTSPRGGLVQGGASNILYGTTSGVNEALTETYDALTGNYTYTIADSTVGFGSVFKLDIAANQLTTIYTFSGSTDGRTPVSSLVLGTQGPLFGVTSGGGVFAPPGDALGTTAASNGGSIFSITNTGAFTTLGNFLGGSLSGTAPFGGLVEGGDENYYGTTSSGGSVTIAGYTITNEGTVFQLSPNGILTTIYTFTGGADGGIPAGGLARPRNGYLYGTTSSGAGGYGTVFKVTSSGQLTTLYTFGGGLGSDSGVPSSKLIVGSDGNLYGTTAGFGTLIITGEYITDYGSVFQIKPNATGDGTGFTTLYNFEDSYDGGVPLGGLTEGPDGTLYGTTSAGGRHNFGTVFALKVPGLTGHPPFFAGEVSVGNGVDYLAFPNGDFFGYYSYLAEPAYIYHFDLGYEYVIDANDGNSGVYLYDFASQDFFYTSPTYPFPYLYDFNLKSVVYYFPDPSNPGHYNTNGVRYFYVVNTGQIISK